MGGLFWGCSSSPVADTKEPFAWTIASDKKTIVGADMDGSFHITLILLHPKRPSPGKSIVATFHMMDRVNKTKC
jgi:hypothetical protein